MQSKWMRTMSVISALAVLLTSMPIFSLSVRADKDELPISEEFITELSDENWMMASSGYWIDVSDISEEPEEGIEEVSDNFMPNIYHAPKAIASVSVSDSNTNGGQCGAKGDNLKWTLDENGLLTISGIGEMADYTNYYSNTAPWDRSEVVSVMIDEGVTSIGNYAFYHCKNLQSVSLPNGLISIGDYAFAGTDSDYVYDEDIFQLTKLVIPESVTKIGNHAFYNLTSLNDINIPDSVVTIGARAFQHTAWLDTLKNDAGGEPIVINLFLIDASNVAGQFIIPENVKAVAGYAAYNNKNITSITVPDSVTYIGDYAFAYCYDITEITLGTGLTVIGDMAFCGCNNVLNITIPKNVNSIGEMALHGAKVESIDVIADNLYFMAQDGVLYDKQMKELIYYPAGKSDESYSIPNSVLIIPANALRGNNALKYIAIPEGTTEIGDYAFAGCTNLLNITIPDSVTLVGEYALWGCTKLQNAKIGRGLLTLSKKMFLQCTSMTEVELSEGLKTLSYGAFEHCRSLKKIFIPDSVTIIGENAFYCCYELKDVSLGNGLKQIESEAFYACESIDTIDFPNNLNTIGKQAFYECTSLTEIIIPKNVTSIGGEMRSTTAFNLSSLTQNSYLESYGAFAKCTELRKATIYSNISIINAGVFYYCTNLEHVFLPETVRKIDQYAFAGCNSLCDINLPSALWNIGKRAFYNCYGLTDIVLPNSVSSIGEEAFAGCVNLITTYIPESVASIGTNAFMTYSTDAKYSYEFFALSDVGATLYDGVTAALYIRTDNPDPDSFYISTSMPYSNSYSDTTYKDIEYKDPNDSHTIKAVDGGYIWVFDPEFSGTYGLMIIETSENGNPVIAAQFEITVNDYDTAYYEWMDEIIASQTTDSMTNFEKMEAISKYLLSTFKYLTNDGNGYLTSLASVPNSPYFAAHRWDSYISPSGLAQFALRIGGFDKVESLYYNYASYGYSWSNGHYLCYCEANGEGSFYKACPLSGTGAVESFKIDFSDTSQLYTLGGLKKNNTVYQPLTIYGISASTAETYAAENDITFIPIETDVQGDINADGKFTVADVVLLQKWLLAVPGANLSNWKNADFTEDNRLDVFDLCLMKRALIQQKY